MIYQGKVSWFKKDKDKTKYEIEKHVHEGKGIRKFRTPKIWSVKNRILYGVLWAENMPLQTFADKVGVSLRAVESWIFEGRRPNEENTKKCEEVTGLPRSILFYEVEEC